MNSDTSCPACGLPLRWAVVLSSHRTSDGTIEYRRCGGCRRVVVARDRGTLGPLAIGSGRAAGRSAMGRSG